MPQAYFLSCKAGSGVKLDSKYSEIIQQHAHQSNFELLAEEERSFLMYSLALYEDFDKLQNFIKM
jgi:hypothetical protein